MRVHVQPRIGGKLDVSGLVSGFSTIMFISVCVHPCHALAEEKKSACGLLTSEGTQRLKHPRIVDPSCTLV